MKTQGHIIDLIIKMIDNNHPKSELYLYGSHARGDSTRLSDWDILVLLNHKKISYAEETKLMDDFFELELETGEVISPLIYSKSEWINNYSVTPLFQNIAKEGVKIR